MTKFRSHRPCQSNGQSGMRKLLFQLNMFKLRSQEKTNMSHVKSQVKTNISQAKSQFKSLFKTNKC